MHREQWHHLGLTQHMEHCSHPFNKENFTPIAKARQTQKTYNLKIHEALKIRRHNTGPGKGLDEDMGHIILLGGHPSLAYLIMIHD